MSVGIAALASALVVVVPAPAAVPPGFTDEFVAGVAAPTALAFTPDGRMLIATQYGELGVYANGSLLPTPALTISVCSNSERGLLGIAVDPAFALNRYIYLYYTAGTSGSCINRVSRFVLSDANTVDPASELILVNNIPSPDGTHNGGDLNFGKDGNLYVAIGDGGCDYAPPGSCGGSNDAARDEFILLGKILRITPTGAIPADNPFLDGDRCNVTGLTSPGRRCQETFAWGLRNPFRLAFDPNAPGTRFFINDVGQNSWEEIDVGQPGADYGWNVREGFCARGSTTDCGTPPVGMTNPIFTYAHSTGCSAITGGAFVPNGVWPAEYEGDYLYGDYVCGKIFRLERSGGGGYAATEFATGLGSSSAVHLRFGPWGSSEALYYTTYARGGEIRRIASTAGSPPPPPTPQAPPGSPSSSNTAPTVAITTPPPDVRFGVGETITLTGSATDAEDGPLPGARLTWRVIRHHGTTHTHPWLAPTPGASVQVSAPVPEDFETATTSFLEVELTARDSQGASTTVTRNLLPRVVSLTFATAPPGLRVELAGEAFAAPRTVASWDGWSLDVSAPSQVDPSGRPWVFAAWSDGGAQAHRIVTPASSATYAARFVPAIQLSAIRYDPPGRDLRTRRSLNAEWVRIRNVSDKPVALNGWRLRDGQGHIYRLRAYTLAPGASVTLHTGRGRDGGAHLYWRRVRHVWGNVRDRATLLAPAGAVADVCRYANRRANLKRC